MWYALCGSLVLISMGITGYCLYRLVAVKNQMELLVQERKSREQQIEYDKKKAEIVSLQSQINPHFLYNTLEVIRSEAILNQDIEAAEMAEALANYFRYNISKKRDMVTLGEEMDNIENYINIQKRRFGERINYLVKYHTDEEEARQSVMPKLILQPLVENSIYHGLEKKANGGTIIVHVTVTGKRLIVQVEDDGPGMDRKTLEEVEQKIEGKEMTVESMKNDRHGGIALANINQRIRMLYGEHYGLTFSSTLGLGTEAEVTIPYREE